jgi:Zn-dependent protease with chaperone function
MTSYRYPSEQLILGLTVLVILVLMLILGGSTLCLLPLFILGFLALAFFINRSSHQDLIHTGVLVSPQQTPELSALVQDCVNSLKPEAVQVIVVPNKEVNAYTFGLEKPKVVVLYTSLLEVMDADELRFVIGHELGHVALGHTWLNTLLGGMAGVPTSLGGAVLITLAFRWWNRACEYSADRAGLIACRSPQKAISALIKLSDPSADTQKEQALALQALDKEDDDWANLVGETLSTHPLIIKRIEQIRQFAISQGYPVKK